MASWWIIFLTSGIASLLLLVSVWRDRSLLLKPSAIFVAYYQLSVMWPSLGWLPYIEQAVPDVAGYIRVIHFTGLILTGITLVTWRKSARVLIQKITRCHAAPNRVHRTLTLVVTGCLLAFCMAWYLHTLGWTNTGLAAILQGREDSAEARESAMKLLGNRSLQYAWALIMTAGAYLCAYFLADSALKAFRQKRLGEFACWGVAYAAVLLAVMMPGARSPALMVLLTTLFVFYARRGFRGNLIRGTGVVAVGLLIPAMLSLLRNNEPLNPANVWLYYVDILDRVAGRSVEDNIWMVAYVQENGFFGPQGIPILARLSGVEPIDVFNIIGRYFRPESLASINANCSFVAVNYACFGLVHGALVSAAMVLIMDATLLLHLGLPRPLAVASAGICAAISMNFAMTLSTTVLVTHGLLPTIALSYLLHLLASQSAKRAKVHSPTPVAAA